MFVYSKFVYLCPVLKHIYIYVINDWMNCMSDITISRNRGVSYRLSAAASTDIAVVDVFWSGFIRGGRQLEFSARTHTHTVS
jgi:hypothetical protein